MKHLRFIVFILIFSFCSKPTLNTKIAFDKKGIQNKKLDFFVKVHEKDKELLKEVGIDVIEKIASKEIDFTQDKNELLKKAQKLLHYEYDIPNALIIALFLTQDKTNHDAWFLLGQCYFFMGEFYYEGYIKKYYEKAYHIFKWLLDKKPNKIAYLKWCSFAAGQTGSFIRHQERGTFSGVGFLKESIALNDQILKLNPKDEDALVTEGEYQIESSGIPLFGGSEKKGVKIYEKVLKMNPDNVRANMLLGKYYYKKKKDFKKAEKLILKAIKSFESKKAQTNLFNYNIRISAALHLARVYHRLKNLDKKWQMISSHLIRLPRSPSGLDLLRDFLLHIKKDKPSACKVAKRLVEMDPKGQKESRMKEACETN